jgi:hypothetical protein
VRFGRLRPASADALVSVALAIAATWPLVLHIATHAPGAGHWNGREIFFETPTNLWNLWWFRFAIVDLHQSPFNGTYTFYPVGADLWLHTMAPLPAAVGAILQTFVGLVVTYNTLTLAALVAAGVAAAALGRRLGLTPGSARVAGAIYTFAPAVFARIYAGHFELLWIAWLPLTLLLFLRTIDPAERGWVPTLALGFALAGAVYTSANYAVYALEAMCVTAVVYGRQVIRRRAFMRLAVASLVTVISAAPMLARVGGSESAMGGAERRSQDFRGLCLDAIAFVVPSFMHPVLADRLDATNLALSQPSGLPQESCAYLGWSVIALAVLGAWPAARARAVAGGAASVFRRVLPIALATVFLVLSLGSELKFLGRATGITMPAAVLQHVPIVNMARAPGRHVYVGLLGVALLAGAGLLRLPRRSWQAALLAVVAFEYWPKVPLTDTTVPRVYHRLAFAPNDVAVLDVPVGARDGLHFVGRASSFELVGQTVHQKPIVGGMASRLSEQRWRAVENAPLVGALMGVRDANTIVPSEAIAYFRAHRIQAIVIHPSASSGDRELIQRVLPIAGCEKYQDGTELWWVR